MLQVLQRLLVPIGSKAGIVGSPGSPEIAPAVPNCHGGSPKKKWFTMETPFLDGYHWIPRFYDDFMNPPCHHVVCVCT